MTTKTKTNYFLKSLEQYKEIRKVEGKKPELLLHVCCGACSCYPLVFLYDLFDITILFSNSNIYPKSEFDHRLDALRKYVDQVNYMFNQHIKIIVDDYVHEEYMKDLMPFKELKEGGHRCHLCITKRLQRLFQYASENNYKYVTTVMTVSRNKPVDFINEVGEKLSAKYPGITFFHTDFKKFNGQDVGVAISKKFGVYRQEYCGCEFSISEENSDVINKDKID